MIMEDNDDRMQGMIELKEQHELRLRRLASDPRFDTSLLCDSGQVTSLPWLTLISSSRKKALGFRHLYDYFHYNG